jgi:hypothetical protein
MHPAKHNAHESDFRGQQYESLERRIDGFVEPGKQHCVAGLRNDEPNHQHAVDGVGQGLIAFETINQKITTVAVQRSRDHDNNLESRSGVSLVPRSNLGHPFPYSFGATVRAKGQV